MTIDERLNHLEDQIQKIKEVIKHNNDIARSLNNRTKDLMTSMQDEINYLKTLSTANNVNMGDIFGNPFGKRE